jgi:choice-of-anchor C domain-containing protein
MTRYIAGLLVVCLATGAAAPQRQGVHGRVPGPDGHKLPKCQASPSGSGLLYDGDFQLMPDIGAHYSEYFAGEPFAPEWRVTRGSIDFNGSTGWGPAAPNNACTVDLDGINPGAIKSKSFATLPSATYTVTFLFSGNGGAPPQIKTLDVEAAGQSARFTWDQSAGDAEHGNWTTQTWSFTATSSKTSVTFVSRDPQDDARGPIVGDISVTQS